MSTNAAASATAPELTGALEDYLSTIYELLRDQKVARVRDIALARGVKAGSVSPALKRLAAMGLAEYAQREYITLTPEGELAARRVRARHRVIIRFLREVMGVTEAQAAEDACALEHSLSDESMDRMVRFFEFLSACPNASPEFLDRFHGCALVHDDVPTCPRHVTEEDTCLAREQARSLTMQELASGQIGVVTQVNAVGSVRQRLLDVGLLPGTRFEVERAVTRDGTVRIRLHGTPLELRRQEAAAVVVRLRLQLPRP